MEILKSIFVMLLIAEIGYFLLRRSFIGRIFGLAFKICREVLKFNYNLLFKTYKIIKEQNVNKEVRSKKVKNSKVVNGSNVVDFKKYKNKKN